MYNNENDKMADISGAPMNEPCEKTYKRNETRQELLLQNNIILDFLSVGCVIRVGCKSFAFSSIDQAMTALHEYVYDPEKEKRKWMQMMEK
jgi:hypothetical protein